VKKGREGKPPRYREGRFQDPVTETTDTKKGKGKEAVHPELSGGEGKKWREKLADNSVGAAKKTSSLRTGCRFKRCEATEEKMDRTKRKEVQVGGPCGLKF